METQSIDSSANRTNDSQCTKPEYKAPIICLLPYMCRQELIITIPKEIKDQDALNQMFTESIQGQYPNHKIYMMSIRCTKDILYKLENNITIDNSTKPKEIKYHIIYLIIPKELLSNLETNNISSIAFYVGKSENQNEYKIIDKAPTLDMISTENNNGKKLPFSLIAIIS